MSWHLHEDTIEDYVGGRISEATAFSLEAHVLACATCRQALSAHVEVPPRDRIWDAVRDLVDRPRVGVVERSLARLGVPANTARLLVAAPAMRGSWVMGVVVSLGFAVLASRGLGGDPLPFLVLAPLLPLLGVATAFGGPVDPAWEIGLSSPTGGFRLTLLRSTAVLATSVGLAGLASLALPDPYPGWSIAAWLLPSLTLTVLSLVLSTAAGSATSAAGFVAVLWIGGVVIVERVSSAPLASFGPRAQVVFALVAVASAMTLAARHGSFERPTHI